MGRGISSSAHAAFGGFSMASLGVLPSSKSQGNDRKSMNGRKSRGQGSQCSV